MMATAALAFVTGGALMLIVAALLTLAAGAEAADYAWPVTRIVDGDTLKVDASADLPAALATLSVRLRGVDTPERGGRAKSDSERERGHLATAFTSEAVAGASTIVIRDPEWGKWGERVIAGSSEAAGATASSGGGC